MALWIRISEDFVSSTCVTPQNGKRFTLRELQQYVGGLIEALELSDGRIMWLNEEGKLNELPYNSVADLLAHQHAGIAYWDHIVGDVLITTRAETGDDEEEEN